MRRYLWLLPLLFSLSLGAALALVPPGGRSSPGEVVKIAEGVYFRHGEIATEGHCNNGFVVFKEFVLAIDANFPSGAEACLRDIRKVTDKPVRFVFDTHHHGDHAYGNPVWLRNGAIPVAHEGVLREMARLEPGRWRDSMNRADVKATGLDAPLPPMITFHDRLVLDDGTMRVELFHLGAAHTRGDGFAYLPREKILFTGDVVVNGAFNFMGDGSTESWVEVIRNLERLAVDTLAPGHGDLGGKDLLAGQRGFIESLRKGVGEAIAKGLPPGEIAAAVSIPEPFGKWVGRSLDGQVGKVRSELLGLELPLELERLGLRPGPAPASKEKPRKIIYAGDSAAAQELEAVAGGAKVLALASDEEILREVADADAVIGKITPEIVAAGKRLRWVHSLSAGVEQYLGVGDSRTPGIEALKSRPEVVLTNGRRCHGPNIADQVFAYLLAFTRGVKRAIEARAAPPPSTEGVGGGNGREADLDLWKASGGGPIPRIDLTGKTLLVIGQGGIGSEVALRAKAFGMKVLATDPDVPDDLRGAEVHPPADLTRLLPAADVVVIACPLTPKTRGLFGAAQFAAMKPGAYFINVARGRVMDPDALVEALRGGKVRAAGLDVTEPEPLPDSSPLWKLENVIITPHSAGDSDGSKRRVRLLVRENVRRFALGEPLLNVVDKEKGY